MPINNNPFSYLEYTKLYEINSVIFWDKSRPPEIEPHEDDAEYLIKQNDRPDLIAYQELGNEHLGWVIMVRNDLTLWPDDFVPGKKIYIPSRDSLSNRGIV